MCELYEALLLMCIALDIVRRESPLRGLNDSLRPESETPPVHRGGG